MANVQQKADSFLPEDLLLKFEKNHSQNRVFSTYGIRSVRVENKIF